MLSTAYSHLKHLNPSADIRLFGQEFIGQSYAVGLAEMLIKGQDASNFKHVGTLKEDSLDWLEADIEVLKYIKSL